MTKRHISPARAESSMRPTKRANLSRSFIPIKVASAEVAAAVDAETPLSQLTKMLSKTVQTPEKGSSIIYWMRMCDLRLRDNRALSQASLQAQKNGIPLLALFVLSPQDYVAHDRSARRIDFLLRNLALLQESLSDLNIPFHTVIHTPRRSIPEFVISFCERYGATRLFGNIEYEVDELRRDIRICDIASRKGIQVKMFHDRCIVEPGVILTKQEKAYSVYCPYQRNWLATVNANTQRYLGESEFPKANDPSVRTSSSFSQLFNSSVPDELEGFELTEPDRSRMKEIWPAGEMVAAKILDRFLTTKKRSSQLGGVDPLSSGSETCSKFNRIAKYDKERDRTDSDTTSRLSTYLSSGVLSPRQCARATLLLSTSNKIDGERTSGVGRWLQEVAWRDFYINVLAFFPRVSMGRPFLEKFAGVAWEDHQVPSQPGVDRGVPGEDVENLKKWKNGMTGVPIVDASMRCMNEMGWVHNRARMITAMYLTKDLMIDWRVGERYFMETLIDGDLSSNNGGWQWCASTGVDPCPYFRIFNPYTQSAKVDPAGDFIRHWVPELRKVRGPDLHNPSAALADKLGYPRPIIEHNAARDRALRRYKNPGEQ